MDGDISKGPMPKWQSKKSASSSTLNGSINTSKISMSFNSTLNSASILAPNNSNKTPQKNGCNVFKGKKTPGKSPSRKSPTPNKAQSKTPCGGDRFIPNRTASNLDMNHYKMLQQKQSEEDTDNTNVAPDPNGKGDERHRLISAAMQIGDVNTRRVFSFQDKAPLPPESHQNPLKVVYSIKTPMSAKTSTRYIPSSPDRILDAPDIINDYYLNLMDWSSSNIVAVALGKVIYLWNAGQSINIPLCAMKAHIQTYIQLIDFFFIFFSSFNRPTVQAPATSNKSVSTRTATTPHRWPGSTTEMCSPLVATTAPSSCGTARKRNGCV